MFGAYFINLFTRSGAFAECAYPKKQNSFSFLFFRLLFATALGRSISGPIDWPLCVRDFHKINDEGSGK